MFNNPADWHRFVTMVSEPPISRISLFTSLDLDAVVVGKSALEYGSRSLRKLGSSYLGGDEDSDLGGKQDETLTKFGLDDSEDSITPKSFPVCDDRHSELIPCLDRNRIYQMRLKLDLSLMEYYKRNCPLPERRFNCLIPPAPGYKVPIKWPKSRDEVWKANIPHTHLAHEKSDQNWMVVKGDKINFPGGGTHFHYGADKYIAHLANMLNFPNNVLNNEGRLRTVFDVGCGVASFGGYLLSSDIIAMSLAPNDVHQNQIQFALERGIPRVDNYWSLLSPKISSDTIRNIMDMKAHLGSFVSAIKMIFLSATMSNATEFAECICHLHKQPCHVVCMIKNSATLVGTPNEGAAWFRLQRLGDIWHRILLIPVLGGIIVGVLHGLLEVRGQIKKSTPSQGQGLDVLALGAVFGGCAGVTILASSNIRVLGTRLFKEGSIVTPRTVEEEEKKYFDGRSG